MRYRYPESNDVAEPIPNVADSLKQKIKAINCDTVVYLRTTENQAGWIRALDDTAIKIFRLLAPKWEELETYEPLSQALNDAIERSLACAVWAYRRSGRDQVDWFFGWRVGWFFAWRIDIEQRLDAEAERTLTEWWKRQGEINLTVPSTPPVTRTRAPETTTRFMIEDFLNRVKTDTGQEVDKTDFWLRIRDRDDVSAYSTDREFRRFQKEDPTLSEGCRIRFLRVLKMSSEAFIDGLADRRQAHIERKRTKTPR
jgi:hypothetical protein